MSPYESDHEEQNGERAQRRSQTYRLLSELYTEPNQKLLDRLDDIDPETVCVDPNALSPATCDLTDLRLDYARLFVGPFEVAAPPYGSTYLDRPDRVMTESTVSVTEWYNREGLDVGLDEPADHIAAELEFVGVLALVQHDQAVSGKSEAVAVSVQKQYEFLSQHLGRWVSEFAASVREHARTEFYRELADETQSFIESDGQQLAERTDGTSGSVPAEPGGLRR